MSIIVWDGKVLAADKRATAGDIPTTVTKIRRVGDCLLGIVGSLAMGVALLDWYEHGADPADYPDKAADANEGANLLVITKAKKILRYVDAHPYEVEDSTYADGSGRPFAMMALRLGKSAAEAVALTCEFDLTCGNGIDILEHGKRGSAKHR